MINWKTLKKIDAHIHILPDEVHQANPDSEDVWLFTDLHQYAAMMDNLGIKKAVIMPLNDPWLMSMEFTVDAVHRNLYEMKQQYPGRFFAFADIDTRNDPATSVQAIRRAIAPNAEYICETYFVSLIPEKDNTSMLRNVFQSCLTYNVTEKVVKPTWDELAILTRYSHHSEIDDEEEWFAYVDAESIAFHQLYVYQLSTLGRETVMSAVYEYLMSENHEVNQVEFLYNLGG